MSKKVLYINDYKGLTLGLKYDSLYVHYEKKK
jgi:hypothetical protein